MTHKISCHHAILIASTALVWACAGSTKGSNPEGGTTNIGVAPLPPIPLDRALPLVFVHGFAGSAQQYHSQAMRFVANGYPPERIRAFDHDGAGLDVAGYANGVDGVVEGLRTEFAVEKVYLVGHSRGTSVSNAYLLDPARAAKIAKYVSLDGVGCAGAETAGVPCIAPSQALLPGQAHVEVATSKQSFVMQYEFLVGSTPQVVDIVRQLAPVEISGRAVNFPANTGREGTTLEIWEIDAETGKRATTAPHATFNIGADGNWGPVVVSPDKFYEKALFMAGGGTTQHFYAQRYLRSTPFIRLLSGPPDSPSRVNSNVTDNHTNLIAMRMREWYGTDDADLPGDESDILEISTKRPGGNQETVNAIVNRVANGAIALHIQDDAATPAQSTREALPYFDAQPFQKGIDVFMPAAEPPDGTITVTNMPRGDTSKPQVLRFPNWASTGHTVSVMFSDHAQD